MQTLDRTPRLGGGALPGEPRGVEALTQHLAGERLHPRGLQPAPAQVSGEPRVIEVRVPVRGFVPVGHREPGAVHEQLVGTEIAVREHRLAAGERAMHRGDAHTERVRAWLQCGGRARELLERVQRGVSLLRILPGGELRRWRGMQPGECCSQSRTHAHARNTVERVSGHDRGREPAVVAVHELHRGCSQLIQLGSGVPPRDEVGELRRLRDARERVPAFGSLRAVILLEPQVHLHHRAPARRPAHGLE
jgi:hypothetical protein